MYVLITFLQQNHSFTLSSASQPAGWLVGWLAKNIKRQRPLSQPSSAWCTLPAPAHPTIFRHGADANFVKNFDPFIVFVSIPDSQVYPSPESGRHS